MRISRLLKLAGATFIAAAAFAESAPPIRLNTVGYLPGSPKHASVASASATPFSVIAMADGRVVLNGQLSDARRNADTDEMLATADFSTVREAGDYFLRIVGLGDSAPFRIAGDVYAQPLFLSTRAMYLWRCGVAVEGEWQGNRFHHAACHTDDAWLDHVNGQHQKLASTGGWHDAGDYNKYVVNAGVTVGAMLRAWEDFPAIRKVGLQLPESDGTLPDYLAEIKFETDWLLTMQAADGAVYTKVSTERFGAFVLPEKEETPRYVCPTGTPATADFVAMLAQAARCFQPYAPEYAARCLNAAQKSYAYLLAHPANQPPDQSKFKTGAYPTQDPDERLWAAAELWETTGDAAVLRDLEARITTLQPTFAEDFDWGDVKNLGLLTYLFSKREGRSAELVEALRANALEVADGMIATAKSNGYARPLGSRYYWGCNGGVVRQTLVLQAAYRLSQRQVYRDAALDALNHVFGRNVDGRSYVTGLGAKPPMFPHDRRSGGDEVAAPWPGYLVGGPHPTARDWKDIQPDARTNEIAINWNAALIYALAGFVE